MNDNNKLPTGWGNFNNGKLPEKWGIFNHSNMRSSPWENTPKTTAWKNSNQTPAWGNTNNNPKNSHSKYKSVNNENVNEAINKFADMAKRAGKKTANKISGLHNKENLSDEDISAADEYAVDDNSNVSSNETVYKDNKEEFIQSVPTTDKTNAVKSNAKSFAEISERLKVIKLPQISSISKEDSQIYIPESEKENLDHIIEKYIEKAGYQPSWKFERYCGEKLGLPADSAVKKYRIKVFSFYMKDLLTAIAELYKFDYVKIYELLPMYQNFFIDETGNLNIDLLVKASSPIMKKLIEGGMLTADGEDCNTVFINNNIEPPPEEVTEQESVSEQEKEVITEPVELTDNFIKPSEPVVLDNKNTYIVKKSENSNKLQDDTPIFKSNYDPVTPDRFSSYTPQYIHTELHKNSKINYTFITVISVIISIIAIFGLISFIIIKDKKSDDTNGRITFYDVEETSEEKTEPDSADKFKYEKIDENKDGVYDYIMITGCDESMTTVTIPSEIEGLPVRECIEFGYNCENLKVINLPDSMTKIMNDVMNEGGIGSFPCPNLESINVSENNPNFTSIDGVLFSKDKSSLLSFPDGKTSEYTIPDGTKKIECSAFVGSEKLKSVIIPDGVTEIGAYAFGYCSNLKNITISKSVRTIGEVAFKDCSSLTNVIIPNNVIKIGLSAFYCCTSLASVTIENPDCEISDDGYDGANTINNGRTYTGVIRGYTGSTAQAYANKYGYKFEAIDQQPPVQTSAPVKRVIPFPASDINNYPQYVEAAKKYLNDSYNFFLADINSDNIPELFIVDSRNIISCVYTTIDSSYAEIISIGISGRDTIQLYSDGCIRHGGTISEAGGLIGDYVYYEYNGGRQLVEIQRCSFSSSASGVIYDKLVGNTTQEITPEEYEAIEYSHGDVLDIQAVPISNYVLLDNTYQPVETYAFYGFVAIDSGHLNLREKPSMDSNVIALLQKGDTASVYYVEGYPDWYKIYTDSGLEGYVSAQFIKKLIM